MARGSAAAFLLIAVPACTGSPTHAVGPQAAAQAQVAELPPQPPDQSAQERQVTDAARQAYVVCLGRAARYADDHLQATANLAGVIAPMCYDKFVVYEAAANVGMSRHDTQLSIRHGDQQQVELAEQAVKLERSQAAALSAPK
jgi:hypothetical protein